jgi:transcriptional regulator with XRE-family HTH domain
MPTVEQIRAARALIGWSQGELAERSGLSQTGIARIENGTNRPNSSTLEKIISTFDAHDIEFLSDNGVRKRNNEIKKFFGKNGLIEFMDDVYNSTKDSDGTLSFYNVKPGNWLDVLGEDWWYSHVERMARHIRKENARILIPEENHDFISSGYATYRWFTNKYQLNVNRTMYIYGGKLSFVTFTDTAEQVEILMLKNKDFANGAEALFDIAWDNAIIPTA